MTPRRGTRRIATALVLAALMIACGGPDLCFNCPSGTPTATPSIVVTGSIATTNPLVNPTLINVVVCVDLPPGTSVADCTTSFFIAVNSAGNFTRNNVDAGAETVLFWVDQNGDGMIDPGDPQALLQDPEGQLDNVRLGQTVTIASARVDFTQNTATATISVGQTPTPAPTVPVATPTPTRTP